MKRAFTLICIGLLPLCLHAQDRGLKVDSEIRMDYISAQGFSGNSLNLALSGYVTPELSFNFKHRFNKTNYVRKNFDATDWIYLTMHFDDRWEVSAGKQVVALGGFEYNSAPFDMYFNTVFWSDMPCYKFGASATYILPEGRDRLTFQLCESPFNNGSNLFGYNFYYEGNHSWFNTKDSFSMIEYAPGSYLSMLALGGEYRYGTNAVQLDANFKYAAAFSSQGLSDFSIVGKFTHDFDDYFSVFAKAGLDENLSGSSADLSVLDGTKLWIAGAGVEYYPFRSNRNFRIHSVVYHRQGTLGTLDTSSRQISETTVNVGISWRIHFL